MKVLSISVGTPREIEWNGKKVLTSIFKSPIAGPVHARTLNLDGDAQSDLTVHGGVDKAIYVYPSEHYPFWREQLGGIDLPPGSFGENLTTEGLLEDAVSIGDKFRVGSAEFMVTQPRMPCFKLGIRFGRSDMIKRFLNSRRSGFYVSVLKEGELAPGQSIERIERGEPVVAVADITDLYIDHHADADRLRRASELDALPESWREYFRERIAH
jgi:MOSC domain-containing protein YiiM